MQTIEHKTPQYDDASLPKIARGAPARIEANREELLGEYRSLLTMADDDVAEEHQARFAEVTMRLAIDPAHVIKDAELVARVAHFERRAREHEDLKREAATVQAEIDKMKDKGPQYDAKKLELTNIELRMSSRSNARMEAGFLKRSKRGAFIFNTTPIHNDNRPLQSGAARLG